MKRILAVFISICVLAGLCAVPYGAFAEEEEVNLARLPGVTVTTNVPELAGHGINFLNDGAYEWVGAGFATPTDVMTTTPFPHYLEFDFDDNVVQISSLTMHAFFSAIMGVTNFGVEYWIDDKWVPVKDNIVFRWNGSQGEVTESNKVYINSRYTTSKMRVVITGANMQGGDYRIDELELMGQVVGKIPKDVTGVVNTFVQYEAGDEIELPAAVDVSYSTGKTGTEDVIWDETADLTQAGAYTVEGTLVQYPETTAKLFVEVRDPAVQYQDVAGDKLAKSVMLLAEDGVLYETSDQFRPDAPLTRLEVIRMIYALKKLSPAYQDVYTDVTPDDFYYGVVGAAAKAEAISVFAGTKLEPDKAVTGAEFAAVLKEFLPQNTALAQGSTVTRGSAATEVVAFLYGDVENQAVKIFSDTGKALTNPDMGFMIYYYDNSTISYDSKLPSGDLLEDVPGTNTVYLRFPWCHVEPEEGVYNWAFIDTEIQKFAQAGKSVMLAITCSETGIRFATPEWVKDAGAKGIFWEYGKGQNQEERGVWMPDYSDPVFLEKWENFMIEYAKKYDGNTNVSVIDVRSLGVWGEGHNADSGMAVTSETVKKHFDLYAKYFTKTPVVVQDDTPLFNEGMGEYAASLGFGIRDDSLPGDGSTDWWSPNDYVEAEPFWQNAPVILETFHMWEAVPSGQWQTGEGFLQAMEDWHASYVSIHHHARPFYNANKDLMDRMNARVGYRIAPVQLAWNDKVSVRGKVNMNITWQNGGTAPFYKGGYPAVTLRDKNGNIAAVFVDDSFNLKDLEVGPPDAIPTTNHKFEINLPDVLPGGEYDVYISVGDLDGTPRIQMPIAEEQPEDRRYLIGKLTIQGDFDANVVRCEAAGSVVTTVVEVTGHSQIPDTNNLSYMEYSNANVPWLGDIKDWTAGFDFTTTSSDWSAEKRQELNTTGKTTITYTTNIDPYFNGKSYYFTLSMVGNDADIRQSDDGRFLRLGVIDVSETGEITVRDLKQEIPNE